MHRTLLALAAVVFSLAALVFAGGWFLRSVPAAQAQADIGPAVTGGGMPLLSFSGIHSRSAGPATFYTVPADRVFVMTAACMSTTYLDVTEDGVARWDNSAVDLTQIGSESLLCTNGNGQIPFPPGSQVGITGTCPSCSSSNYSWFVQGYLIHD